MARIPTGIGWRPPRLHELNSKTHQRFITQEIGTKGTGQTMACPVVAHFMGKLAAMPAYSVVLNPVTRALLKVDPELINEVSTRNG